MKSSKRKMRNLPRRHQKIAKQKTAPLSDTIKDVIDEVPVGVTSPEHDITHKENMTMTTPYSVNDAIKTALASTNDVFPSSAVSGSWVMTSWLDFARDSSDFGKQLIGSKLAELYNAHAQGTESFKQNSEANFQLIAICEIICKVQHDVLPETVITSVMEEVKSNNTPSKDKESTMKNNAFTTERPFAKETPKENTPSVQTVEQKTATPEVSSLWNIHTKTALMSAGVSACASVAVDYFLGEESSVADISINAAIAATASGVAGYVGSRLLNEDSDELSILKTAATVGISAIAGTAIVKGGRKLVNKYVPNKSIDEEEVPSLEH